LRTNASLSIGILEVWGSVLVCPASVLEGNYVLCITAEHLYDGVGLKRDHLLVEVLHGEDDEVVVDTIKQSEQNIALLLCAM